MDGSAGAEHYRAPLLLHSLAEFREIIYGCLDAAGVRSIAEVGAEDGHFTSELLQWSAGRDVRVVAVDPEPSAALLRLAVDEPRLELVAKTSLDALPELDALDAYVIDGDHNHYTVLHELRAIASNARNQFPIVLLHDVAWPWARRDLYYAPDVIPDDARQPYTFDAGVVPGDPSVVAAGFRGEGEFAVALTEGGANNGVRTAVEDFMAERPGLVFRIVPAVFGLGVLFDERAPYAGAVDAVVAVYDGNPLIERLERNRLDLYMAVLGGADGRSGPVGELRSALEQAQLHIRDLESENKALWAERAEHEERAEAGRRLAAEVRALIAAKPFRVAETVARLRSSSGVSRAHVEAVLRELGL